MDCLIQVVGGAALDLRIRISGGINRDDTTYFKNRIRKLQLLDDRGFIFGLTADSSADVETVLKEVILTVAVRKTAPAFTTGGPSTSTVDGIKYSIGGSMTLTSLTVGVTPETAITAGLPSVTDPTTYEYRSFSLDGSNGLTAKGFLRAMIEMP